MEYKVGDTVKLVSKRPGTWNPKGDMDRFLGSVQKIEEISDYSVKFEDPDTHVWAFSFSCINSIVTSSSYPKVMWVRADDDDNWRKRVVFMEKAGRFIAWASATTIEEVENIIDTTVWRQAKDIQPMVELTIAEIAEKFQLQPEQIRIKE